MIQSIRILFLAVFFLVAFQVTAQAESKIHITKTGAKYHRATCRYAQTGWSATLTEAKDRGLTACLVCKPGGGASSDSGSSSNSGANSLKSSPSSTSTPSTSGQCKATTKAGSQCSIKASSGSSYCWQHVG